MYSDCKDNDIHLVGKTVYRVVRKAPATMELLFTDGTKMMLYARNDDWTQMGSYIDVDYDPTLMYKDEVADG